MVVGFEAFSGVTAFGGLFLGPQDNSFATVNTATVAVEYTCRAPIEGTGGANRLEGGNSAEAILGLGGDDTIRADGGNDRIYGDAGHDNLAGGDGNDRLTGGAGADTFVFTPGGGRDVVADFGEGDQLDLSRLDVGLSDVEFASKGEDTSLRVGGRAVATLKGVQPDEIGLQEDLIL